MDYFYFNPVCIKWRYIKIFQYLDPLFWANKVSKIDIKLVIQKFNQYCELYCIGLINTFFNLFFYLINRR